MEKYIFLILVIIALVGVVCLINESSKDITGAAFLSDRLCQPGFTSTLYIEKSVAGGYTKPTVICIEGDRVPALRDRFILGEENADKYDAFRTDPYRFRAYT